MFDSIKKMFESIGDEMQASGEKIEKLYEKTEHFFSQMSDFFSVVGGFFSFLGLQAILLIIATFSILYLLGIVSPLERKGNFVLAVSFGTVLFFISGFGPEVLGKYLLVMLFPMILSYGVILIYKGVKILYVRYAGKKEPCKEALLEELLRSTAEFQRESDVKELRKNLQNIVEKL